MYPFLCFLTAASGLPRVIHLNKILGEIERAFWIQGFQKIPGTFSFCTHGLIELSKFFLNKVGRVMIRLLSSYNYSC